MTNSAPMTRPRPRIRWPLVALIATVGALLGWRLFWAGRLPGFAAWHAVASPVLEAWIWCMLGCTGGYIAQGFWMDRDRDRRVREHMAEIWE